jgi:acyl-CoA synthetase (AMP-forming)/AMP-acid ligase II
MYTSGTTGMPKAIMHSHRSMLYAVMQNERRFNQPFFKQLKEVIKLTREFDWRFFRWGLKPLTVLAPAPMHHLLGYSSLIYGLLYGYHAVIVKRFHPRRMLKIIEKNHVNAVILAPSMVAALLNDSNFGAYNLSSVLYIMMGSAPCPPDLVRRARKAFGCPVVIGFGTTEVGGSTLMTNVATDSEETQSETVGRVIPGIEAQIVDEQHNELPRGQVGELALRLKSIMVGYYKAPEATAEVLDGEGWYYTGDLATMNEQGYIRIVGRKKELIIRGGQNIYPAEHGEHNHNIQLSAAFPGQNTNPDQNPLQIPSDYRTLILSPKIFMNRLTRYNQ